ncbi:aldehyde dehydrogenase [Salinisphaera hydrothermalis EPR70]
MARAQLDVFIEAARTEIRDSDADVCDAMVHGGPFPAPTDTRSASVGTTAITRCLRPVCYQNFPNELLPRASQHDNREAHQRLADGQREP